MDFLFGQKVTTITKTTTRVIELKDTGVAKAITDYHMGRITKDEFNKAFPKLRLR